MGNCLGCYSLKGQRDLEDSISFKITNWIDSSDFSSKPDLEVDCNVPSSSSPKNVHRTVEVFQNERVDVEEGYLTAVEHIESEDEHPAAPSINTSYETSDEQVEEVVFNSDEQSISNDDEQNNNIELISTGETSSNEADEECISKNINYELRPIRPMPTPVRENVLSPSIRLEQIVNESGRVSHKRLMKYMELRQKKPIPLKFPEVA